jgi:replicative DNA helicase
MEFGAYKQLPYSAEAEMSVLGSALLDGEVLNELIGMIGSEDFYLEDNKLIFESMVEMFAAGSTIDVITVIEQLRKNGIFDKVGGRNYLMQLIEIVPTTRNVDKYAKIVADKSRLRALITACSEIEGICIEGSEDAKTITDLAEQKIYAISQGRNYKGFDKIIDVILMTYDRLHNLANNKEAVMGIPTGFRDLDRILIGLSKSDLILLAARPGMGKTSFALNILQNVAQRSKKAIALFSLEMSKEQLVSRMLSSEAMIEGQVMRTGELSDDDWVKLSRAAGVLSEDDIYIDDTSGISVAEIKAKCRRVKNLGLVVIDYLQLLTGSRRSENRVQEISEISRGLKIMAKELDIPVICLSQLSRAPEARTDKRPMLSDLRESGAIEQDADIVMFLYRDDYYNPENVELRNIAECIVAKNRHGQTGKAELSWMGQYTRFFTLEKIRNDG